MSKIREAYLQRCEIGLLARERNEGRRLCAGKMILCVTGAVSCAKTRQRGGGGGGGSGEGGGGGLPLAWIYCARDATATWYLLSAGRLPTNVGVIKPRECSHRARCARIQRHLLCTRYYTRETTSSYNLSTFLRNFFLHEKDERIFIMDIRDVLIHGSP